MYGVRYRLFLSVLSAVTIVQPETIIRWHRVCFRLYWRWRSRSRGGRPKVPLEIRRLIREMSLANRLWGAPRIHGELLKLGIDVAQSTVTKYMAKGGRGRSQTWKALVRHGMADGPPIKQWNDLLFGLRSWAQEANAWAPGTDAGGTRKELTMTKRKSDTAKTAAAATASTERNDLQSRKPRTKLAQLEAMLRRPNGATIEQISKSLVWQAHSVRGAMSGTLKKKQGLTITNARTDDGRRLYRIA